VVKPPPAPLEVLAVIEVVEPPVPAEAVLPCLLLDAPPCPEVVVPPFEPPHAATKREAVKNVEASLMAGRLPQPVSLLIKEVADILGDDFLVLADNFGLLDRDIDVVIEIFEMLDERQLTPVPIGRRGRGR
jgi:hypothetical protein